MQTRKLRKVASSGVVDLILMAAMAKSKVDLGKKLKVRRALSFREKSQVLRISEANTSRVARLTGGAGGAGTG